MPRNQGTSRKGKPKKHERAAGMGRSLQKAQPKRHTPSSSTGGMTMRKDVVSINLEDRDRLSGAIDNRTSVLDVNDLDDFLIQAEMAEREFVSEKEQVVVLDPTARAAADTTMDGGIANNSGGRANPNFAFQELSVPRRPVWDDKTTSEELDKLEKESFLDWRRAIAEREEVALRSTSISSLGVTPFEKNIEIWRQLWRVLERCSCIIQIVDARNPLFYLSKDLKEYATKELGKPMLLLINKSDYLSPVQRQAWHEYFSHPDHEWEHVFFSAHEGQQQLDEEVARAAIDEAKEEERRYQEQVASALLVENDDDDDNEDRNDDKDNRKEGSSCDGKNRSVEGTTNGNLAEKKIKEFSPSHESSANVGVESSLSRVELLDWLKNFGNSHNCPIDPKYNRVPFGMVGFPNTGKSSVINVLMGNAKNAHGVVRVGVAAQPGKTKHFQTLLLPDRADMLLCDCPGLVFPSFVNNTADLIAAGVYPIAQMRDWRPVMNLLCHRIHREVLNAQYSIKIPLPTADALYEAKQQQGTDNIRLPPPTADEFLTSYCVARSMLAAVSGVPDYQRASRIIIMEYATGKLLYCHSPPSFDEEVFQRETLIMSLQKTKKLRDKLVQSGGTHISDINNNNHVDVNVDDDNQGSLTKEQEIEDIDMLLEILGGSLTSASNTESSDIRICGQSKRQKKWGKKGRKGRNKDPYGCHSTPDEELGGDEIGTVGVSVKGGKKYNHKNYTRTTGYGSTRAFK